jgi:hypothetical protein
MFTPIGFFKSQALPFFSATGGTQSEVGDYTVHTFTSTGVFSVTGSRELDVFLVGGGGNGASGNGSLAGTGGNGAQVLTTSMSFSTNAYTIRVGNGGNLSSVEQPASTILLQANAGDNGIAGVASGLSDGGDGAGGVNSGGNGGIGITNNWQGSSVAYAGGGGGGAASTNQFGLGTDGGGDGGFNIFPTTYLPTAGASNRGGGGGGGYRFTPNTGASGGSGIVIIRYLTNP